jgi:hypothetical protein
MMGLQYAKLMDTTKIAPHFRGNKDRFPMTAKRDSRKYFIRRQEDGHTVFDIVYGVKWDRVEITESEYKELYAQGVGHVVHYKIEDVDTYVRYVSSMNIIGTVRPDNTFEFNKDQYHQGERGYISSYCHGYLTTDSRRGGMIYSLGNKLVPVWRGMRIDVSTMQPNVPYEVFINHVDRKKAKELLSKYERFYKVSEVMLKNMSERTAIETAREIINEAWGEEEWRGGSKVFKEAERLIDDAPVDAFLLYCISLDIDRFYYSVAYERSLAPAEERSAHERLFLRLKNKLNKELYKQHADVFKEVKCEAGTRFPACDWGVKIVVDGKEMEQYT